MTGYAYHGQGGSKTPWAYEQLLAAWQGLMALMCDAHKLPQFVVYGGVVRHHTYPVHAAMAVLHQAIKPTCAAFSPFFPSVAAVLVTDLSRPPQPLLVEAAPLKLSGPLPYISPLS